MFDSAQYWEERYATGGNSGPGSYGESARYKADFINAFVHDRQVTGVIELGCGDGNQLLFADYPEYVGVDVSQTVVKQCNQLFLEDDTKIFVTDRHGIRADLALSLDVIYHLVEDRVFWPYMWDLFDAAERYVIIYANDVEGFASGHVKWRKYSDWIVKHAPDWHRTLLIPAPPGDYQDFHVFEKVWEIL